MAEVRINYSWDVEIRRLMRHFGLESKSRAIIAEVKATAKGNESNDVLYDRAWRRFKTLIQTS